MSDIFDNDGIYNEPDSTFYGEFAVLRAFQAFLIKGRGVVEYDDEDADHEKMVKGGQKISICFEYQTFPIGVDWQTYPRVETIWSKSWGIIQDSLCDVWGIDTKNKKQQYGDKLRQLCNEDTRQFARWENVKIGSYTKKDTGEVKHKYAPKILALYASEDECWVAYDKARGNFSDNESPAADKKNEVEALESDVVLSFVTTLAKQNLVDGKIDQLALRLAVKNIPMLGDVDFSSDEVIEVFAKIESDSVPF